jgi:hypothetical protein
MCEIDEAQQMRKLLMFGQEEITLLGIKMKVSPAIGLIFDSSSEDEIREEVEDKINSLRDTSTRYNDHRRTGVSSIYVDSAQLAENYSRRVMVPFVDIATTDWKPVISFNSQAEPGIVRKENYVHVPVNAELYDSWSELVEDNSAIVMPFIAVGIIEGMRRLIHANLKGVIGLEYEEVDGRPTAKIKWTDYRRGTYDVQLSDLTTKNGVLSQRSLRKFVYSKRATVPRRKIEALTIPWKGLVDNDHIIAEDQNFDG